MEQAKARNPNIKLVGLAWGAPGWIGNGNFWSTDTIDYLVAWLGCAEHARADHRLPRRVEREGLQHHLVQEPADRAQLARLRHGQDRRVGRLRLGRRPTTSLRDPAFGNAVDVFGAHYVCGYRQRPDQLPELRQRREHRQAAVGQRERLGRLQRRRAARWPAASTAATSTAR